MEETEKHPALFWNFSLLVYADADVARTCLDLQDAWGADVNVVLFVLWHGCAGHRLDRDCVHSVDEAVRIWRERVVRPLRSIRKELKTQTYPGTGADTEKLRNRIKADELEAERIQQLMLESIYPLGGICSAREKATVATLVANLVAYLQIIEAEVPAAKLEGFCDRVLRRVSAAAA